MGTGQTLALLEGTVINTGQLSAPGGQILVTAVPGSDRVQISQQGQVLTLEIQPLIPSSSQPNSWTIPILALPDLLTTGSAGYDLGVTTNADGTLQLTVADLAVPADTGTAIIAGDLDATGQVGGSVGVFGDRVGIIGANINVSGVIYANFVPVDYDLNREGNQLNLEPTNASATSDSANDQLELIPSPPKVKPSASAFQGQPALKFWPQPLNSARK